MSSASSLTSGAIGPGTVTVVNRKSFLNSVALTGDGTNAATAIVYDNASVASGKILASLRVLAGGETVHQEFTYPVRADEGITVIVTGIGAVATVAYDAA